MEEDYIHIIPLGGLGEFGMNTMLIQYKDEIVVIDAGLMFPESNMPGIDLVVPDLSYLAQKSEMVKGIVLTHAHEDHVGGLPYLLQQLNVPIYGTKFTLALASSRLREFNLLGKTVMHTIEPNGSFELGAFKFDFIQVSHSIPDSVALAIHTPAGIIIHSGDFKMDQTPVDGKKTNLQKLAELGQQGVLLLMSDSTNVDREGFTPSERAVYPTLDSIFMESRRRIFVSTFSSSLHRIQQIMDLAVKHRRYIAVTGRSLVNNIKIASELGYLEIPKDLMTDAKLVMEHPSNKVIVLTTGSQGEPMSALALMAMDNHARMKIEEDDTVIISARIIPGNEVGIGHMMNHIARRGAEVICERDAPVHVSGHGSREELKLMLSLTQPKFFTPIHGEYRHLIYHARLAADMGTPPANLAIAEDGDIIRLSKDQCIVEGKVQAGKVLVDGSRIFSGVEDIVLRDRQHLSQDGMVIPIVVLDNQTGNILVGPDIVSRGFVYMDKSEELINEVKQIVRDVLESMNLEERRESAAVQEAIRRTLRKHFSKTTDRSPMVVPVILEI